MKHPLNILYERSSGIFDLSVYAKRHQVHRDNLSFGHCIYKVYVPPIDLYAKRFSINIFPGAGCARYRQQASEIDHINI